MDVQGSRTTPTSGRNLAESFATQRGRAGTPRNRTRTRPGHRRAEWVAANTQVAGAIVAIDGRWDARHRGRLDLGDHGISAEGAAAPILRPLSAQAGGSRAAPRLRRSPQLSRGVDTNLEGSPYASKAPFRGAPMRFRRRTYPPGENRLVSPDPARAARPGPCRASIGDNVVAASPPQFPQEPAEERALSSPERVSQSAEVARARPRGRRRGGAIENRPDRGVP